MFHVFCVLLIGPRCFLFSCSEEWRPVDYMTIHAETFYAFVPALLFSLSDFPLSLPDTYGFEFSSESTTITPPCAPFSIRDFGATRP